VSLYRRAECRAELFALPFDPSKEDPIAPAAGTEVAGFNLAGGFAWVAPFGPAPECLKDRAVDVAKGALVDDVAVVLCPAANEGIEHLDEFAGWGLAVGGDEASYLCEQELAALIAGQRWWQRRSSTSDRPDLPAKDDRCWRRGLPSVAVPHRRMQLQGF
jgi:hypothetical protein